MIRSETASVRTPSVVHPVVTSLVAAGVHGVAMSMGSQYGYNIGYASLAAAAVLLSSVVGRWAWAGGATRLARVALGLGIASAAVFPAYFGGWPLVLGLTAVGMAIEYRNRVGSWSSSAAIGLVAGLIGCVAGVGICFTD
jgi:hypothetical protein